MVASNFSPNIGSPATSPRGLTCIKAPARRHRYHDVMSPITAPKNRTTRSAIVGGFHPPLVLEMCRGARSCPNACLDPRPLLEGLEPLAAAAAPESPLPPADGHHRHRFTISLSLCPNACSRPQIADIGIIGAAAPTVTTLPCAGCRECAAACPEGACRVTEDPRPVIGAACINCRQCVRACPLGTLTSGVRGYRLLLGGRLGRHPNLARELAGIHSAAETLDMIERVLSWYTPRAGEGRLGDLMTRAGLSPACIARGAPCP